MGNVNPETLDWLDQLEALKAQFREGKKPKREVLKAALQLKDSHITTLLAINACFDPAALDKVRQAAQSNPPFILSSNCALSLTKLRGKVPDLPKALHESLDQVIARHLIPLQIDALVSHIASGKPAQEFDHTKVKRKSRKAGDDEEPEEDEEEGQEEETEAEPGKKKKKKGKGAQKALKQLQKAGGKGLLTSLKFTARLIHKYVHEGAKATAGYFCPLHSRSSRKHGGSSSTPNLFRFLGHWGLYWFCVLFSYSSIVGILSFIGHFIPIVGPLIDNTWSFLFHLAIRLILWVLAKALANPLVVLAVGAVLIWSIHKIFKQDLGWIIFIAVLLGASWYFRGMWMPLLGRLLPTETKKESESAPKVVEMPPASVPTPVVNTSFAKKNHHHLAGSTKEPAQPNRVSGLVAQTQVPSPTGLALSPKDQARVQAHLLFVKGFIDYLFGPSYHDIQGWMGNLKGELFENYQDRFFYENYPPAKIQEIQDKKWNADFKPTQPIQWLGSDRTSDQFLVRGIVTTQSDLHYQGEVVSTEPVTVKIWVDDYPEGPKVFRVEKAN